jgi:hypothetical protein
MISSALNGLKKWQTTRAPRIRAWLAAVLGGNIGWVRGAKHGRVSRPAVAVVGVWDPFLPSHASMLAGLRDHAVTAGLASVAVLIDPAPGAVSGFAARYGAAGWPVYDSVPARVGLMRHLGLDAVLCMRFRQRDFKATAAEFLDAVQARVKLEELWLGAMQLLGPGDQGGPQAVAHYADRHGLRLTMLPRAPVGTYDVRSLLASGRVRDAAGVVGRPPIWRRPPSGALRLSWGPGPYRAVALDRPEAPLDGAELEVVLTARRNGPPTLAWPRPDIRYLAFTSGPADSEAGAS